MTAKSRTHKKADLEHFRELLEQRRDELIGTVRDYVQSVPDSGLNGATGDSADHASSDYTAELFGALLEKQTGSLEEVERALEKFDRGGYATCETCEEQITVKRLKALPWARLCRDCQEKKDRAQATRAATGKSAQWDADEE